MVTHGWREEDLPADRGAPPWKWIFFAWGIVAVLAVSQSFTGYALRGVLAEEWKWALLQIPRWLGWAFVTPIIFAAARRFPLTRSRLPVTILVHLVIAILIALIYEAGWLKLNLALETTMRPMAERRTPSMSIMFVGAVLPRVLTDIFLYTAVLAISEALASRRRLVARDIRGAQLETDLALAQVHALKMQVHPHFLFNTLHAVNVLIREDPAAATEMVSQLGDLLRLTLSRAATPEVTFRKELEILRIYLEIERFRFRDRLEIVYDVADDAYDALVPDLVLQPLVENAIKHGVSRTAGPATITVRAKRRQHELWLEIADSGKDFLPDSPMEEGIGLNTTRARLERLYGSAQRLTLERGPGGGCIARVVLPFREGSGQT